jgi:hypothetical protein
MGKPLVLVRGEHYFIARCPETNEVLDAIPDSTGGQRTPVAGEWIVACPTCVTHTFVLSEMRSERLKERVAVWSNGDE